MRKVFLYLAVCAGLVVTAGFAAAQTDSSAAPPPTGHLHGQMNPAMQAEHLAKRLGLNSEQQTQVQAILTNQQTEMKALDQNQTITHQQWIAQTKSVHEATESKIEALLNDTQKQEFQQMIAHMHHGPPPAEGDAAPPPQ